MGMSACEEQSCHASEINGLPSSKSLARSSDNVGWLGRPPTDKARDKEGREEGNGWEWDARQREGERERG